MAIANKGFTLLESLLYLTLFSIMVVTGTTVLARSSYTSEKILSDSENQSDMLYIQETIRAQVAKSTSLTLAQDGKSLLLDTDGGSEIVIADTLAITSRGLKENLLPSKYKISQRCEAESRFFLEKLYLTANLCVQIEDKEAKNFTWHFKI